MIHQGAEIRYAWNIICKHKTEASGMTMQCSKMESSSTVQIICPVHICIEKYQCLNNLPVAILACLHQSSLPPVIPKVDLNTGFKQQRDNLMVALRRGIVQR